MLDFRALWKGNFIQVVTPTTLANYEVVHELDGIIVFPIIVAPSGFYTIVRNEFCPPYIMKSPEYTHWYTVISGTRDHKDEPVEQCMLRELREETGLEPIEYETIWQQDNIPMYKGSDRRSTNYILLIRKFNVHKITSDGSEGENLSSAKLINLKNMKDILQQPNCDYLLYSMYNIVLNELPKYIRA
jgi:8-oxo-dGTP pyrophosphatase MutT (NUDIX family)